MKPQIRAVILYKGQPGLITALDSEKITITLEGGEKKVREKDINLLNAGPVQALSALFSATLPAGDTKDAVDFFSGESPSYAELTELIWGAYPPEASWAVWQAVRASPFFECDDPAGSVRIRSNEEIETMTRKEEEKQRAGAERMAAIGRLKGAVAGTGQLLPDDARFLQDIEALALGMSDKSRSLKEAGLSETPVSAHSVLLATGLWKPERNPWPSRHGLSLNSSTAHVPPPPERGDRLDLTALDAWAIDNAWSSDPDDAVSLDGDALWVHVADPASTVLPDSDADKDARGRGSTLYVPEGASRMLADASLDFFALGLASESFALSFRVTFTDSGAIDEVSIHRTVVRVTRLTYAEASSRRDEPGLAGLFKIAERNVERRKAADAVFIELPETHVSVGPGGDGPLTVFFERVADENAADMVREMMLIAGEAAARFAFKNGIPFQYVSQERPEIPKDLPPGLAGEYRKRRSMRSRKVGTIPSDHAGLGLGMYSQVTSPLRRYGDLVSHQQLRRFLEGKPPMDTDDMLTRIASGDSAARECTFAERESNMHWMLVHLSRHPEWTGDAIVVEIAGSQATILIPEFAQESRITTPAGAELNASIRVRAGNVRIPEQTISFIPLEAS